MKPMPVLSSCSAGMPKLPAPSTTSLPRVHPRKTQIPIDIVFARFIPEISSGLNVRSLSFFRALCRQLIGHFLQATLERFDVFIFLRYERSLCLDGGDLSLREGMPLGGTFFSSNVRST